MNYSRLLFIATFFLCMCANAQISNLAELGRGSLQIFSPIIEKGEVYGYFGLFYVDKIDKTSEKYEYAILDKNLNKIANGEFVDVEYKGMFSKYFSPSKSGNKLLLTKRYLNTTGSLVFTSSRFIDINKNEVSVPFYFEDRALQNGNRGAKTLKKIWRKKKRFRVPISLQNGYIVYEIDKPTAYYKHRFYPNYIVYYNNSNEKQWDAYLTADASEKVEFNVLYNNDEFIYILCRIGKKGEKRDVLKALSTKTGQIKYEYELENKDSDYNHTYYLEVVNNSAVIVGKISPYKSSGYDKNQSQGLFKIVIDNEGNQVFNKHMIWGDIDGYVNLNSKGKDEDGFRLFAKDYFIFKDSGVVVLTEKVKSGFGGFKMTDFMLFQFDENFDLIDKYVIEKDVSKGYYSDYLFSQYINDNKDAVFFYQDYKEGKSDDKDKNWILGIVSFKDGKMKREEIPISSDDFFIQPYVAKKGYILLREFNKDAEFDEIRLEKINLD